ncbi:MAG: TIGR00366 family protein [Bacteroidota bacterium]
MTLVRLLERVFGKYLPSPMVLAVLLTLGTIVLAVLFGDFEESTSPLLQTLLLWEQGIWNEGLLVFAYQMMLLLLLGHVLVLSPPMERFISNWTLLVKDASSAAVLVALPTLLLSFFNWGVGLIFGALLARKVGEHARDRNIPINYPLVGACGYVGLMIWHGGISGSAPLKVAEQGHLKALVSKNLSTVSTEVLPSAIPTVETIFSLPNLLVFFLVTIAVTLMAFFLGKRGTVQVPQIPVVETELQETPNTGRKASYLAFIFGGLLLITFCAQYLPKLVELSVTPNMLNFLMLGLAILLHGNFKRFLNAVAQAIGDVSGILIQFPLYFGIMGIMTGCGLIDRLSLILTTIASETTLPVFTFFSAALVNLFVPSGGGQWAVQGPLVIESSLSMGVPLPKTIIALAYGDQWTNMLQPFWALPLLAITRLKAGQLLPYTLVFMIIGGLIFLGGLFLF